MGRTSRSVGSYTSQLGGLSGFLRESFGLYRAYKRDVARQVGAALTRLREIEELMEEWTSVRLEGRSMLDIGAGQRRTQMIYFTTRGNQVIGVDRDLVLNGFNPMG